jgi:2-keto-4-pentenoate hydratase/2-oxohepta-3-ene-1,7-dioic acid hydratase in catechol pathway
MYGVIDGKSVKVMSNTPFHSIKLMSESYPLDEVRLLAPCLPSKIVALGVNYRSHAQEMNSNLPKNPLIFLKPPTAVIGPEDKIVYPPSSHQVDYEGELGVVIRKKAKGIAKEQAKDYILGYTCVNDVTARDLQKSDGQWTRSKGFDTFAPIGPCIETELDDSSVDIETYLNDRLVQKGNTRDLVFGVPELVSFVSHVMTLLPGDIIATGTPAGVGPMQPGDTLEIKIKGLGSLRNYVVRQS